MRIGIITGEYPPMQGGVGAYTHILARELAEQGQEISILSSHLAANDTPEIHLTSVGSGWGMNSLAAIRRWANDIKPDVINLQFQTAAYKMSPWIHFLPDFIKAVPVVTTFHDLRYPYLFPKAGELRNWIVMHLVRRSAGVIVTNHEDAAHIANLPCQTLIPIGSNILSALPPDFDPLPWREKAGANTGDFLLAYFGLMNRSKGVETLLKGLANLRAMGIPARLVIIGGAAGSADLTNAAYAQEIETQIHSLGIAPFVQRTGFVDDAAVGSYLKASDVVVLPFLDGASYRRGSLMAAIHYGTAIVTTIPNVHIPNFGDSENMLFVPAGYADALTNALSVVYQAPDTRERLRDGAEKLANVFDWSKIAADYSDFFRCVIGAGV